MKKFLLSFAAMFVAILFVVAEIEGPSANVTPGANADADYTVNEAPAVKVGTQDLAGVISIDVPANTASVTFNAGALKESGDVKITVTNSSTLEKIATITVRSYDELTEGVKDLTVNDGNTTYAVAFDEPIAEATTISLTSEKPFLIWNVVADPTAPYASKVANKDFSMVKVTFPNAENVKIEELGMALLYNGDEIIGEANDKTIKVNGNVLSIPFSMYETSEAKKRTLKKSFYEHETFSGYHVYIYAGDLLIDEVNTEEDLYIPIPVEGSENDEEPEDPTDYKVGADITSLAPATWEGQTGTYSEIAGSVLASNTASIAAGNVLTQTISDLKNGIYNVDIVAAGASASGMPTGNELSVVFAGDKSKALPVVEGANVTEDKATKVSLYAIVTDGKLTYGIKNLAAAGNWYAAKVESIRYVSESTEVQNVTIGDDVYVVYSQNLFVNGSFENGVEGWKAVNYNTAAEEKNFAITATGGFDGGAYITTNAGNSSSEKTIRQSIAVVEGKSYLFTTYTSGKAPETNNYVYNALFQMTDAATENGALKPFNWGDAESSTWTKTEYVFTAQEGNPYVGVRMGWNANSSFDGFALVEVEKVITEEPTEQPEITKIEDGDYFIYNVEAKAWLGGANSWGTQASLVNHPQRFTISANADGTYNIDSHAYNNETNHFFADGLYIDSPAFGWTIKSVKNGYAFAVNEDNYVASVEGSTVLGTVGDINAAAATWKLYTEADLLAAINSGESTDATFLIKGASISRNLYNDKLEKVWEGDAFGIGGANENFNAEKWGGNSQEFDVYQTISLPNGTYKLSANGYYRYNNTTDNTNDIAISSHADGTEEINTFLYANDAEVALKSIADDDAVAALTEAGKGVPFNQTEAGAAFDMGLYLNEVEVKVTDGTLKLGVKKTAHPGCDWSVWDNFVLTVVKLGVEPEETIPAAEPEPAAMEGYSWTANLVNNGDFTGSDLSSFPVQGAGVSAKIIDGPNGAKVYEIQSADMVQFAWDSQVFIVSNEVLNEGDYYLVSFSYKAEVETTPSTQAHATPGNYLHWAMLNPNPTFSTEWKTTTWTGQISAAQAKGNDGNGNGTGMTTIAFNLNDLPTACKFYITNVVVKKQVANVVDGIASVDAAAKANGKYIENGKVVIVKNGVKYNVAGARVK
ncbi:MAG: hypothetical protein MJZ41_14675 [Bacteroidaceae bacterium]|nr:hypothetical protein [Bacteroidaceae bacterium]